MSDLVFTQLICSRICHDLVGPIGALGNGIELMELEDDPTLAKDALELLKQSSENAARRLKFLRLAFGAAGGDDQPFPAGEVRKAALEFYADHRFSMEWREAEGTANDKVRIRLAMNLAMAGAAGLLRGGVLSVAVEPAEVRVVGTHDRAGLPEPVVAALEGRRRATDGQDARIIEAYHARLIAEAAGRTLAVRQSTGRFEIVAT
ncbi:MAG: histidine phosphotransferase family protein [Pseudomonadota bacterium]|nr:histidine phosphotransferase family protein [Pseudomonadota bacterium]